MTLSPLDPPALGTDERRTPCPDDLAAVRAWARSRGYPVDESASVPEHVVRTYRQVHLGLVRRLV